MDEEKEKEKKEENTEEKEDVMTSKNLTTLTWQVGNIAIQKTMDTFQHCLFRSPLPRTSRHLPSGLAVLHFSRRCSRAFPNPDVAGAGAARTVAGEGETGAIARTGAAQTGTQPHESQSAGGWELLKG